jgi:hypothetical protein
MAVTDEAVKLETLAKLAQSRAEIRRVLEPPPRTHHHGNHGNGEAGISSDAHDGTFPRSRTMKLLMSGRGIGTAGAIVGGLLMARPALALKLLRMLPTGAVARMLMVKAVTALRSKH